MGGGYVDPILAVWHAIKVDRTQRDILKASVKARLAPAQQGAIEDRRNKITDDIEWLSSQVDRIEDARNDAMHSPFWSAKAIGRTFIVPLTGLGHVRAKKFQGKNILDELRWCRDTTITLRNFAIQLDYAMYDYRRPWPDRPKLPTRPAVDRKKPLPPTHKAKRLPLPQSC
jgi:hypothetical protein